MSQPAPRTPRPAARPTRQIDPVRILRQHAWLFTFALFGGAVFGVVVHFASLFLYPIYSAQVLFELRPQLSDATEIIGQDTNQEETVIRLAQTEAARMTTRDVLTEACKNRDIESTDWAQGFVDPEAGFMLDDAVDELEEDLSAGHRRGTNIFFLGWSAHKAEDVPVVLNTIKDTYLRARMREDEDRYGKTRGVFDTELKTIDGSLGSLKVEQAEFMAKNNLTSFEENAMQAQKGLEELGIRIAETTRDLTLAKAQREQVNQKISGALTPSEDDRRRAEADPVIMQMARDLSDAKFRVEAASRRFGPDHPEVASAERYLKAAEARHQTAIDDRVARNLQAEFRDLNDKVLGLQSLLDKQNEDHSKEYALVASLAKAHAELKAKKDRIEQLQEQRALTQQRISEIDVLKVREDARRVQVVQAAMRPRELTFPQPEFVIPAVAVLCLGAVMGIVFAREMLDQRVRSTADLAGLPAGRVLGIIPDIEDDPAQPELVEGVVRSAPTSATAESIRQGAVAFSKSIAEADTRVVAMLSTGPESGVTSAIVNLATCMALSGRRVLAIDANFRRPALATAAQLEEATGLGECLSGAATIGNAVRASPLGFDVLGAGAQEHRTIERLTTDALDRLLAQAREGWDLVLVDLPPVVVANEALSIAGRVDATCVVMLANRDPRGLLFKLVRQLEEQKGRFLGVFLDRVRVTAGGYLKRNMEAIAEYGSAPAQA